MHIRSALINLRMWLTRRYLARKGVVAAADVRLYGRPRIALAAGSSVLFGADVVLCSNWRANSLEARGPCIVRTLSADATIRIGNQSGLTAATLSALNRIVIGDRVLVGAGALITDTDHHRVDVNPVSARRSAGLPAPDEADAVHVGDDVFIGARAIVLKGVHVGAGSVIAAGSVVTRDVPPMTVVAGNPAKVVRKLGTR